MWIIYRIWNKVNVYRIYCIGKEKFNGDENMINKIKNIIRNKWYRKIEENDIELNELEQLQNDGAIIIDVRSPQEYREGHIGGAISIPEYEIKKEAQKKLKNKNETIVVYCSSGGRSKKAQKQLRKLGYQNVYNLYEGYNM